MTQVQAARKLGISLYEYRRLEAGELEDAERAALPGGLRDNERCYIARQRASLRLEDLAPKVGVTMFWLCQMERGTAPTETLVAYWQAR